MSKVRIVERTKEDGTKVYVIQCRYRIFFWKDANGGSPRYRVRDNYPTLESAKENLCHFDGTKIKEKVVYIK